jgi:hypothetical protein
MTLPLQPQHQIVFYRGALIVPYVSAAYVKHMEIMVTTLSRLLLTHPYMVNSTAQHCTPTLHAPLVAASLAGTTDACSHHVWPGGALFPTGPTVLDICGSVYLTAVLDNSITVCIPAQHMHGQVCRVRLVQHSIPATICMFEFYQKVCLTSTQIINHYTCLGDHLWESPAVLGSLLTLA